MKDLTEQQEQEMIRLAKEGDPEANYQMSLWALDQAIAEPEEERWNRLAAKCLVKAAEAGYEPAKEKMNELLLQQSADAADAPPADIPAGESAPRTGAYAPADTAAEPPAETSQNRLADIGAKLKGFFAAAAVKAKGLFARSGKTSSGKPASEGGSKPGFLNFSQWDDAKWKKMQLICVIICVVLVLLIVILLISGKNRKKAAEESVVPTPVAEVVDTPVPSPTPTPAPYPSDAIKQEIAAASLDTFPEDADFVTEAQTVTVSTNGGGLNIRRSPGQSAGIVGSMPNGTTTDVYAFKNGWALVKYEDTWGWCSKDYLK